MWPLLATVIVVLGLWLHWINKNRRMLNMAKQIPGPPAWPIVGNAIIFMVHPQEFIRVVKDLIIEYGDVFRIWLGTDLNVVVSNPEDIKILLTNNKTSVKGPQYKYMELLIGQGILSGSETLIGLSREEMLALPHLQMLIDETPNMYKIIFDRMTKWYLQLDPVYWLTKFYKQQKEYMRVIREFSKTILKYRMDKLNSIDESERELINSGEESINSTKFSVIDKFILSQELNATELLDETFTVFTTSQEALAKISSTILLLLAFHPKCQEKLYEEIVSVMGKKDRPVTCEDIKQLPYLDMVFKEVIRLFPIAGLMQRTVTEDIAISTCIIPAGASLVVPTHCIHRNARYWPNPDAFDPDRFSPENIKTRNPYCYIPFSLGPMDCLGRHFAEKLVKIIVIRFIQSFKLTTFNKYEDLRIMISISTTPMDGFNVNLAPRLTSQNQAEKV